MSQMPFAMSWADVLQVVQIYWIIAAGMLALYFYGRTRFNSLEYAIDFAGHEGQGDAAGGRLITPAPPIFTTSRRRYIRFALYYVAILEAAFIAIVFFSSLVADAGNLLTGGELTLPTAADPLQHRALFALFVLTGLLSSIPGLKDVDAWMLRRLHKAAYIPDDARILAESLYDAPFAPTAETLAAVRPTLVTRDAIRAADGQLIGGLEQRLIQMVCLRTALVAAISGPKYTGFRIKLDRDLREVANRSQELRAALRSYLQDQAKVIPAEVTDIDTHIAANMVDPDVAALAVRRRELQDKCDGLYETLCLLAALAAFATETDPEDMSEALAKLGFTIECKRLPLMDWDAVARVVSSMFMILLAANACYAWLGYVRGIPAVALDRAHIVKYTVVFTVNYAAILILALKRKRKWRAEDFPGDQRPENLILALSAYVVSLAFTVPISYVLHGELTTAPFLYAASQAVLGYFIGLYIDRGNSSTISVATAAWQGALQLTATLTASLLSTPLPGAASTLTDLLWVDAYVALQSGFSGVLIGLLFQHFYKRTMPVGAPIPSPVPAGAMLAGSPL
ncbi:MAG: hypothetical protein JO228_09950 [Xanthobacteraceae bacterium]|nr:hypothetical protein [Xanthobacteraceae bacterium]